MKSDRLYLIHIREALQRIMEYTSEGPEVFRVDPKTRDAVVRNFEVIGEATKRHSEETKRLCTEIPWRRLAGFRDILIHRYDGIDVDVVWRMVEDETPVLASQIKALLERKI